ncbi:zinc finger protein 414 [Anabas testudineus]|uniref:C2H2-type domain-containing protein n=1 Tax=Anabas testudineus TaxID=64144 RepID=A0A3Q1I2P1_ANATE|nr:zinc finger protein 414 [Anabas testudineus]
MATSSAVSQKDENGNKRTPCPLHGCKRVYTDISALESHIKDHEIPAQSLPGKVLLCSTVGCSGSFPDMQKLMEHMRHHHKPNIYFLCESCRTKLRSYRGLLTHLHTCSKVPRGKTKSTEPTPPQPAAAPNSNVTHTVMEQDPPHLDSQPASQVPNRDGSFHAAVLHPDSAAPPVLGPPFLAHLETSAPQLPTQQLTETAPQLPIRNGTSNMPPPMNVNGPAAASDYPDAQDQSQTQSTSPEPVHPAPGSAPHSPSGSSAVWKRNQGTTHNRRILWEHTKGRYTCVQCGQTATNRKEMTQHISSYHSGNKPAEDTGSSAANT